MAAEGHGSDTLSQLMPPEIPLGHHVIDIAMFGLVVAIFLGITVLVRRNLKNPRSRVVSLMEMALEYIESQCVGLMGAEGKAFVPFFTMLFTLLLVANVIGLIPWLKSPTATHHVNMGMAIVIFFMTHYFGIKKKGVGYFKHFVDPWYAAIIMLPIHVVDEIVKPITLTARLMINMYSKEVLLGALGFMFSLMYHGSSVGEKSMMVLPFLVRTVVILLGVVIGAVQALVFTLLSIVYVAMAIEDHEDHDHVPAPGEAHAAGSHS